MSAFEHAIQLRRQNEDNCEMIWAHEIPNLRADQSWKLAPEGWLGWGVRMVVGQDIATIKAVLYRTLGHIESQMKSTPPKCFFCVKEGQGYSIKPYVAILNKIRVFIAFTKPTWEENDGWYQQMRRITESFQAIGFGITVPGRTLTDEESHHLKEYVRFKMINDGREQWIERLSEQQMIAWTTMFVHRIQTKINTTKWLDGVNADEGITTDAVLNGSWRVSRLFSQIMSKLYDR